MKISLFEYKAEDDIKEILISFSRIKMWYYKQYSTSDYDYTDVPQKNVTAGKVAVYGINTGGRQENPVLYRHYWYNIVRYIRLGINISGYKWYGFLYEHF